MRLRLHVSSSPPEAASFEHPGPVICIGRSPKCELHLAGDANQAVSWEHVRIELTRQGAYVSDVHSSNGTFLNDKPVEGRTTLRVGDRVQLGKTGPRVRVLELELSEKPSRQAVAREPRLVETSIGPAAFGGVSASTRNLLVVMQSNQRKLLLTSTALVACLVVALLGLWLFRDRFGSSSALQSETAQVDNPGRPKLPDNGDKRGLDRNDDPEEKVVPGGKGKLHLLAVGVSQYRDPKFNLSCADKDAEALVQVFQAQQGELFKEVRYELLTNSKATRAAIVSKLHRMKKNVTQYDLVIVTLSGHGEKNKDNYFYFLPYDFDVREEVAVSGVSWSEFQIALGHLPCQVLVVMDTCHSGAITQTGFRGGDAQTDLNRAIEKVVEEFKKSPKGLVLMAACLSDEKAHEKAEWGHGALSLALLEGISGKRIYTKSAKTPLPLGRNGVLWLQHLDAYLSDRVSELAGGGQAIVTQKTANISLGKIPISLIPDRR